MTDRPDSPSGFSGFRRQALRLLRENRERNNRAWFEVQKPDYPELLLEPFQMLVAELTPDMRKIDALFETRPAVDRTISRLRRDTRFSPDKSLYRDRMWLSFKRPRSDWTGHPAFYFEVNPAGYRYGGSTSPRPSSGAPSPRSGGTDDSPWRASCTRGPSRRPTDRRSRSGISARASISSGRAAWTATCSPRICSGNCARVIACWHRSTGF